MVKKKSKNKKKIIWILAILIIIVIIILIGARTYLYIRVLIGNDLVVKLDADKENLFLQHEESDRIKITSYAITNIFCETNCLSKFIDLSSGLIIEEENFSLKLPKTKDYNIRSPKFGTGKKLYRFDLECYSPKTILCETKGNVRKNSLFITLNYELTNEEKKLKQELQEKLSYFLGKIQYYDSNLNEFDTALKKLEKNIKADKFRDKLEKNKELIMITNSSSENLAYFWSQENYFILDKEFNKFNDSFFILESEFYLLNDSINSGLQFYNNLIDKMIESRNKLKELQKQNMTENSTRELDNLINEFNNLTIKFSQNNTLANKSENIYKFINKTQSYLFEPSNYSKSYINMSEFNYTKILLTPVNFSYINLDEPIEKCCLNNVCEKCCDNSCYDKYNKYPIIFLHGHSFNERVSAEASLQTFEDIQRVLDKVGYLNAGSLFLSSSNNPVNGGWSKINHPLTIKASYYFDILTNAGKNVIIQTKTDNLDSYTLRLKEIINEIKFKTNRKKVIIVAHSMGGLIARRYIQVFGENDVEKLILITTPNHGIEGKTLALCHVFGTKLECADMGKDSLFINKLNNAPQPQIPIYNIIGIGCETEDENGDGVVTNSSQYLEYADNYFIKGSCNLGGLKYFHVEIVDVEKYPKVLEFIKKGLKENSSRINI